MRKIIFFDIDGTLTGIKRKNHVYDSTKEAIIQLQKQGHIVCLATGRATFRAKEFQQQIQIPNMICEGGNEIVVNYQSVNYEEPLQEEFHAIYEEALRQHIGVAVSFDDNHIRYCENDDFIKQAKGFEDFMEVRIDPNMNIYKQKIRRMFISLPLSKRNLITKINTLGIMTYQGNEFLIIEPDNKYKGIKKLVAHLQEDLNEVVVFGDGLNDVKMFENASYTIAMGNAIPELKKIANEITYDSDHDGIYIACKRHGWI